MMAELINRNEREAELAKIVQAMNDEQAKELEGYLADAKRLSDVPKSFWERVKKEMSDNAELAALLLLIFNETAQQHVPGIALGSAGPAYVAGRLKQIAPGFVQRSKDLTSTAIRDAQSLGSGLLSFYRKAVKRIFGKPRSKTIADTEGNLSMITGGEAAVTKAKLEVLRFWAHSRLRPPRHSNADEKPCPICSPMEGRPDSEWNNLLPGLCHPNCDCFPEYLTRDGVLIGDTTRYSDTIERFGNRIPPGWLNPRP